MPREYTSERKAASVAWTRAWRERNKDRIRAYELTYKTRRAKLARKRRKADPERYRRISRKSSQLHREQRRRYMREYRKRQLAKNPQWGLQRMREYARCNPGYWSQAAHRRRLRLAWLKFSRVCAANRPSPSPER